MERSGRLAFLLLALAAAGAYWLNGQLGQPAQPRTEAAARAGYYMTEAELTRPGEDGLPRYRLIADEVRQNEVGGPTSLADVRVEYAVYTATPWLLTAPEGELSADLSTLELAGGVVVAGEVEGEGDTRLETPSLTVDTAGHIARTDEPVRLAVGDGWLSARGMVVYLLDERLQLQSSVHGEFQR